MQESFDDRLSRLEKKVDRLLARRRVKDSMQRKRISQQNADLRHTIKQMKLKDYQRNAYVQELEGFLRIQRNGDKDI